MPDFVRSPGAGKIVPVLSSHVFGAIAQLGERIVRNDEVVGSIPTSSTKPNPLKTYELWAKILRYSTVPVLLQENGYRVWRFLCEDVGKRLDEVLDAVIRALSASLRAASMRERMKFGWNNLTELRPTSPG